MFEFRQYTLLFFTAAIWGSGFIAQKLGVSSVSPFTFTFFRTFIGALFLLPVILALKKVNQKKIPHRKLNNKKALIAGSVFCGFFLILSESFQQFGLVYTDVNKASFITSLYMVFVPVLGILAGHRLTASICLAVILSCNGLYLFCIHGDLSFSLGDLLVLMCSIGFALHILVISYFIEKVDGVALSCGQFFAASFFGLIMMLFSDIPSFESIKEALPAMLYAGIMSNGIAYTLQIVGQRGINPTVASLILSLESVFGAVFGVLLLNEIMTLRELAGAALMFTAVLLTQVDLKKLKICRSNKFR